MGLREAFAGVHVLETCHNYARADDPLSQPPEARPHGCNINLYNYRALWESILSDPESFWGRVVEFDPAALSEWVARVPGLYWRPGSEQLRRLSPAAVESQSDHWLTFTPWAKSQQVSGGIGTLRLAPAADGSRLVTLTMSFNASCGFPALLSADAWDAIAEVGPVEGRAISSSARWQPMAHGWSERFQSTLGLPRGCLVIDDPAQIRIHDEIAPVQIHPFTVMEYIAGARELFDFVYALADTGAPRYRQHLAAFFNGYKDKNERYGRYLLAGDTVDPLWDAEFASPAALRSADPTARPQLELLEARVRERMLGQDAIDKLLDALGNALHTPDEVIALSADVIRVPSGAWYTGGSVYETISEFVNAARSRNKLTELIEVVSKYYPTLLD